MKITSELQLARARVHELCDAVRSQKAPHGATPDHPRGETRHLVYHSSSSNSTSRDASFEGRLRARKEKRNQHVQATAGPPRQQSIPTQMGWNLCTYTSTAAGCVVVTAAADSLCLWQRERPRQNQTSNDEQTGQGLYIGREGRKFKDR